MESPREKINREMRSGLYAILILKAIDDLGESYGYEIQKYIERKSGGKIKLKDATVYPVLRYLSKKGVVESHWTEPGIGVPRKYYRLTTYGKRVLRDLISDYLSLVSLVNGIIGGDGSD